jgi:hypothetical protein
MPGRCCSAPPIASSAWSSASPPASTITAIRAGSSTACRRWSGSGCSRWRWEEPVLGPAQPDPGKDLIDHDELRHDPVLATLSGKLAARRPDCAPLAGKSTLNRLEHAPASPGRYHRIDHDPAAIEALFVNLFIEAHDTPPKQIILDLDATDDPLHGHQEGRFFHGHGACPRACGGLLLLPAAVHLLRPALARRQAAPVRHRWERRRGRGGRPGGGADPGELAAHAHPAAGRFRLCSRGADGMV